MGQSRRNIFAAAAVLALVQPACTFFREMVGLGPVTPKVQLVEIRVKAVTLNAMDLVLGLKVENPNGFELQFTGLQYELHVGESLLASGNHGQRIKLTPESGTRIDLPVKVSVSEVVTVAKKLLLGSEDLSAVIHATAKFKSPVGDIKVEFEDRKPLKLGK